MIYDPKSCKDCPEFRHCDTYYKAKDCKFYVEKKFLLKKIFDYIFKRSN